MIPALTSEAGDKSMSLGRQVYRNRGNMNIQEAINKYVELLGMSRSPNTARAYGTGYRHFLEMLDERGSIGLWV